MMWEKIDLENINYRNSDSASQSSVNGSAPPLPKYQDELRKSLIEKDGEWWDWWMLEL